FLGGQPLDQELLTALHAVLLAACLHDRVHVCISLDFSPLCRRPVGLGGRAGRYSVDARAFAAERRRPPLRPRRRGLDCMSSGLPSAGTAPSAPLELATSASSGSGAAPFGDSSGSASRAAPEFSRSPALRRAGARAPPRLPSRAGAGERRLARGRPLWA